MASFSLNLPVSSGTEIENSAVQDTLVNTVNNQTVLPGVTVESTEATSENTSVLSTIQKKITKIENDLAAASSGSGTVSDSRIDTIETDLSTLESQLVGLNANKADATTLTDLQTNLETSISTQISNLVSTAPSTLDTLAELAMAVDSDENFSATIVGQLAQKASLTEVNNGLSLKADISSLNTLQTNLESDIATKAPSDQTYTISQIDNHLALKANTSDVYTTSQVDTTFLAKSNAYNSGQIDTFLSDKVNTSTLNLYPLKTESESYTDNAITTSMTNVYTTSDIDTKLLDYQTTTNSTTSLASKANVSSVYTKTELDGFLGNKAEVSNVYSANEIDTKLLDYSLTTAINTLLSDKADKATTYTTTSLDTKFSEKANATSVYTTAQTDALLATKADSATGVSFTAELALKANISDVYTQSQIDTSLNGKAEVGDSYTKNEADVLLNSKSSAGVCYTKSESDALLASFATTTTDDIDARLGQFSSDIPVSWTTDISQAITSVYNDIRTKIVISTVTSPPITSDLDDLTSDLNALLPGSNIYLNVNANNEIQVGATDSTSGNKLNILAINDAVKQVMVANPAKYQQKNTLLESQSIAPIREEIGDTFNLPLVANSTNLSEAIISTYNLFRRNVTMHTVSPLSAAELASLRTQILNKLAFGSDATLTQIDTEIFVEAVDSSNIPIDATVLSTSVDEVISEDTSSIFDTSKPSLSVPKETTHILDKVGTLSTDLPDTTNIADSILSVYNDIDPKIDAKLVDYSTTVSITSSLADKADIATTYTKSEVDTKFSDLEFSDIGGTLSNLDVAPIMQDNFADLPSASTHHGKVAHVHLEGKMYFSHGGQWVPLSTFSGEFADLNGTSDVAALSYVNNQVTNINNTVATKMELNAKTSSFSVLKFYDDIINEAVIISTSQFALDNNALVYSGSNASPWPSFAITNDTVKNAGYAPTDTFSLMMKYSVGGSTRIHDNRYFSFAYDVNNSDLIQGTLRGEIQTDSTTFQYKNKYWHAVNDPTSGVYAANGSVNTATITWESGYTDPYAFLGYGGGGYPTEAITRYYSMTYEVVGGLVKLTEKFYDENKILILTLESPSDLDTYDSNQRDYFFTLVHKDALTIEKIFISSSSDVSLLDSAISRTTTFSGNTVGINYNDLSNKPSGDLSSYYTKTETDDLLIPYSTSAGVGVLLSYKADLNDPSFTGTPVAPTAATGTNTTQIATTEFVTAALSNIDTGGSGAQHEYKIYAGDNSSQQHSGIRNILIGSDLPVAENFTYMKPPNYVNAGTVSEAEAILYFTTAINTGFVNFHPVNPGDHLFTLTAPSDSFSFVWNEGRYGQPLRVLKDGVEIHHDSFGKVNTSTSPATVVVDGTTNIIPLKANITDVYLKTEAITDIALAGTPTAPTATAGTNSTQLATTEFVNAALSQTTLVVANTGDLPGADVGKIALVTSSDEFMIRTGSNPIIPENQGNWNKTGYNNNHNGLTYSSIFQHDGIIYTGNRFSNQSNVLYSWDGSSLNQETTFTQQSLGLANRDAGLGKTFFVNGDAYCASNEASIDSYIVKFEGGDFTSSPVIVHTQAYPPGVTPSSEWLVEHHQSKIYYTSHKGTYNAHPTNGTHHIEISRMDLDGSNKEVILTLDTAHSSVGTGAGLTFYRGLYSFGDDLVLLYVQNLTNGVFLAKIPTPTTNTHYSLASITTLSLGTLNTTTSAHQIYRHMISREGDFLYVQFNQVYSSSVDDAMEIHRINLSTGTTEQLFTTTDTQYLIGPSGHPTQGGIVAVNGDVYFLAGPKTAALNSDTKFFKLRLNKWTPIALKSDIEAAGSSGSSGSSGPPFIGNSFVRLRTDEAAVAGSDVTKTTSHTGWVASGQYGISGNNNKIGVAVRLDALTTYNIDTTKRFCIWSKIKFVGNNSIEGNYVRFNSLYNAYAGTFTNSSYPGINQATPALLTKGISYHSAAAPPSNYDSFHKGAHYEHVKMHYFPTVTHDGNQNDATRIFPNINQLYRNILFQYNPLGDGTAVIVHKIYDEYYRMLFSCESEPVVAIDSADAHWEPSETSERYLYTLGSNTEIDFDFIALGNFNDINDF